MICTKNLKNSLTFGSNNSVSKNLPKERIQIVQENTYAECCQNLCRDVVEFFIIEKNNPNCPTAREWLSKLFYIHIMEQCSAHKNDNIGKHLKT